MGGDIDKCWGYLNLSSTCLVLVVMEGSGTLTSALLVARACFLLVSCLHRHNTKRRLLPHTHVWLSSHCLIGQRFLDHYYPPLNDPHMHHNLS